MPVVGRLPARPLHCVFQSFWSASRSRWSPGSMCGMPKRWPCHDFDPSLITFFFPLDLTLRCRMHLRRSERNNFKVSNLRWCKRGKRDKGLKRFLKIGYVTVIQNVLNHLNRCILMAFSWIFSISRSSNLISSLKSLAWDFCSNA